MQQEKLTKLTTQRINKMSIKQLKSIIGSLARRQGFYGQLYRSLEENNNWKELAKITKKENIKTSLDLIMFLEC